EIDITFDDIDKEIRGRFQTYGSGVKAELVYYFPDVNGWYEAWEGQLKAPKEYGWATLKTIITNGSRSRELLLPGSNHPVGYCRFTFGGLLPSLTAVRSNGCPYDRHLGGSTGNLNGGVLILTGQGTKQHALPESAGTQAIRRTMVVSIVPSPLSLPIPGRGSRLRHRAKFQDSKIPTF